MTASLQSSPSVAGPPFGSLLRTFRTSARLSQLELGLRANVSARHISFIETGKARPSREMVGQLATTLDLPLRDRNLLLTAAGFAERYRESDLSDPELTEIRQALELILEKQEPWPAIVFDARWTIVQANPAAGKLVGWLLGPAAAALSAPDAPAPSFFELLFAEPLRSLIENWAQVAAHSLDRVRREVDSGVAPPDLAAQLEAALALPEVQRALEQEAVHLPGTPLLPAIFSRDGERLSFYSTVTTFGTPQDITLQELRIESFFPADAATRAWLEA